MIHNDLKMSEKPCSIVELKTSVCVCVCVHEVFTHEVRYDAQLGYIHMYSGHGTKEKQEKLATDDELTATFEKYKKEL